MEGKTPSYNNLFDVPLSPELGKILISDLGTGDVNNYLNSFIIASSSESSTASVVVSTTPTYTTLEPATTAHMHSNMSILKDSPGGAHLREDCQGSRGLSCVPPPPLSPACLNSLDVNFKRMFSIL